MIYLSNIINVGSDRIGSDIIDIRSDLFSPDAIGGQAALAWSHQSWLIKPGWARAGSGSTKVALGLVRSALGEVGTRRGLIERILIERSRLDLD